MISSKLKYPMVGNKSRSKDLFQFAYMRSQKGSINQDSHTYLDQGLKLN